MNSLSEICDNCQKKTEQSINNLLRINQELQAENDRLKSNPAISPEIQYLVDLCGQMTKAWEPHFDSLQDGIQEIIKAYKKVKED